MSTFVAPVPVPVSRPARAVEVLGVPGQVNLDYAATAPCAHPSRLRASIGLGTTAEHIDRLVAALA